MVALSKQSFSLPYFLFFYVKTFAEFQVGYRKTCFNGSEKSPLT